VVVALLVLVLIVGLSVVLLNRQQQVSVDLLFAQLSAVNVGVLLVVSFVLGCLLGLLITVLKVLPLKWQLRQIKQQLGDVQKQNARPPQGL